MASPRTNCVSPDPAIAYLQDMRSEMEHLERAGPELGSDPTVSRVRSAWRSAAMPAVHGQDPDEAGSSMGLAQRAESAAPLSPSAGSHGVQDPGHVEAMRSWRQRAALVLRLALRVFGGRQWSLPGLLLRILTLQVLIALVFQRRSLKEALVGTPLCRPTHIMNLPQEQRTRLVEEGARFSILGAAIHGIKGLWLHELQKHGFELLDPQTLGIELEGQEQWTHTCIFDASSGLKAMIVRDTEQEGWVLAFGAQHCLDEPIPVEAPRFDPEVDLEEENTTDVQAEAGATHRTSTELEGMICVAQPAAISRMQAGIVTFNLLGGRSRLFAQAASLAARLQTAAQQRGLSLRCSGQSLGGALATYAALHTELPGIVFNPVAIGVGLQVELGEKRLREGVDRIDVFSASSDWASDPGWTARGLTEALNLLGIRTAAVVGKQWIVPSAYDDLGGTHVHIIGTFSHQLERHWAPRNGTVARDRQVARRLRPSQVREWSPSRYATLPLTAVSV